VVVGIELGELLTLGVGTLDLGFGVDCAIAALSGNKVSGRGRSLLLASAIPMGKDSNTIILSMKI
jgi:hypothetical protein